MIMEFPVLKCLVVLCTGALIGIMNFGGLWVTVRRLPLSRRPARLSTASFVVRMATTTALIAAATGGKPILITSCLAGYFIVRQVFVRRLAPDTGRRIMREGGGAS